MSFAGVNSFLRYQYSFTSSKISSSISTPFRVPCRAISLHIIFVFLLFNSFHLSFPLLFVLLIIFSAHIHFQRDVTSKPQVVQPYSVNIYLTVPFYSLKDFFNCSYKHKWRKCVTLTYTFHGVDLPAKLLCFYVSCSILVGFFNHVNYFPGMLCCIKALKMALCLMESNAFS